MYSNKDVLLTIRCLTYNHAPYIRQCLDGFIMQKTNFRFEAIVHDDASTDGTADIVREYAEKYPDIIKPILQTENQYSKRDGSIRRAINALVSPTSKYIAICEGDDYWIDPLKLQKQVDFLEVNRDYSMCFHNAIKYYEDKYEIKLFNCFAEDCDLSVHDAIHNWVVPTASILGRKEVIGRYPDWLYRIYSGDYSSILIALNAGKIRYINGLMSVYRVRLTGTSATSLMKDKQFFILEEKIKFLTSFNKGTHGKYAKEILSEINFLKKEKRYRKAVESNNVFLFFSVIDVLLRKVYMRIMSKLHMLISNN